MKVVIALVSILSCISCSGQGQETSELSKKQLEKIDRLFRDFDRKDSPGYAIGISKGTKTLYTKGYGSANLDYEIPITSSSAFDIASVSKQFTAACIALLIMEGKLTLETPVNEFIPELKKYDDTIRLKHLIYNSSGIIDYHRLPRPDGKSWITFNYFDIDYIA